jgi:hypothetical protein
MSSSTSVTSSSSLPIITSKLALHALRTQASDYGISINARDLRYQAHYMILESGTVFYFPNGGGDPALDECVYIKTQIKSKSSADDEELWPMFAVTTKSESEALKLNRLMTLYYDTKLTMDNHIEGVASSTIIPPSSLSPSSCVVKKKRKIADDEDDITKNDAYQVRLYAHRARNAKALLLVAHRDANELGLDDSIIRNAESDYEYTLTALRREQALFNISVASASDNE